MTYEEKVAKQKDDELMAVDTTIKDLFCFFRDRILYTFCYGMCKYDLWLIPTSSVDNHYYYADIDRIGDKLLNCDKNAATYWRIIDDVIALNGHTFSYTIKLDGVLYKVIADLVEG